MLSTIFFNIVTPDCGLIHAQCRIRNDTIDNIEHVSSTTLFNAVVINPEQVVGFLLCIYYMESQILWVVGKGERKEVWTLKD